MTQRYHATVAIFFDNSALSRLVEMGTEDRDALVAGLRTLGVLRLTAPNVYETARTPGREVRMMKLQFYKSLAEKVAPINSPVDLLRMLAESYESGRTSTAAGDELAYNFLTYPEVVDDEVSAELTASAKEEQQQYLEMHAEMRLQFDRAFEKVPKSRFRNEDEFLHAIFESETIPHQLVDHFYHQSTGVRLRQEEVDHFFDAVPAWRVFIAAHLHAMWLRSLSETPAGKKKVGIVDTDSAAYLPFCDRFITNDRAQLITLQIANAFNLSDTRVELFDDVRSRLML